MTYPVSVRELQVVEARLRVETNADAAKALGIAESTVEKHLSHVYRILRVHTHAQAVYLLTRSGQLVVARTASYIARSALDRGPAGRV